MQTALNSFWRTRDHQTSRQQTKGDVDRGQRGAVTGGKHADAIVGLIRSVLLDHGIPASSMFTGTSVELPGYFRPEKKWDLLIVHKEELIACLECKSQVGSFGNNYNNRTEEAVGNAADLQTAYREGAFSPSPRPWCGYVMLLQDAPGANRPVGVREPHFPVFDEFRDASYADRYRVTLTRLVRESLYDRAALVLTERAGRKARWREPSEELTFERMLRSLLAHWLASPAAAR